ncbi:Inovirus Gp2 [Comamonadaceae bacterium]
MHDINAQHDYFTNYPYIRDIYSDLTHIHHKYESVSLMDECIEYINRIFYWNSQPLIVRADLRYSQDFSASATLERVQRDRKRLLADRRNFPELFHGLLGYMWCIEIGEMRTGYHIHLLLIYDGQVRTSSSNIVDQLYSVWKYRITKGEGEIFSPNLQENQFAARGTLGIGLIHRSDVKLRVNLIERVVAYLVKKSSYFNEISSLTLSGRFRSFGRGEMPPPIDPEAPRRGRPPSTPLQLIHK